MRGPGAGGFTPPTSLAASNPCLNCGTNVQLDFCPECGQREIDPDPTLKEFLHELAEEFLHWDGKLGTTFRTLVTKPGELTLEYLAGRRVRFISPLRLYLTCSVLYFFCAAVVPIHPVKLSAANGTRTQIGLITIGTSDTSASFAELDSLARTSGPVMRHWNLSVAKAMHDLPRLAQGITAASPNTVFLLLPLVAGLFTVAFRDRRRRYPQHLAFALHVHAMLFLVLIVLLAERFIAVVPVRLAMQAAVFAGMAAYTLVAARRVYGGTRGDVLVRLIGVSFSYFVLFATAMLAVAAIIIYARF